MQTSLQYPAKDPGLEGIVLQPRVTGSKSSKILDLSETVNKNVNYWRVLCGKYIRYDLETEHLVQLNQGTSSHQIVIGSYHFQKPGNASSWYFYSFFLWCNPCGREEKGKQVKGLLSNSLAQSLPPFPHQATTRR